MPKRAQFTRERNVFSSMVNLEHDQNTDPFPSVSLSDEAAQSSSGQPLQPSNANINVAQIKKENENLRSSIKKLNLRLGDETLTDDENNDSSCISSNDETETETGEIEYVNTRNYQIDNQFAEKYYFITNVSGIKFGWACGPLLIFFFNSKYLQGKGDRFYLDEVKIELSTVQLLKKMNSTYPKTSSDFDRVFLSHLLEEVFTKDELKQMGKSSTLRNLKPDKLKLTKGSL